jgi:hypothetical protein
MSNSLDAYNGHEHELEPQYGLPEPLPAAERIQEYAWTRREQQIGNLSECDMLDACATEIYTACGFQDLTAQRIRKVVEALRFLDERLKSILEATGLAEDFQADEKMIEELDAPPPAVRASDIWMSDAHQAEIDDTFDFFVPAAISEPTMVGAHLLDLEAEAVQPEEAVASIAPIEPEAGAYDFLSTEEKIRAFR